MRPSLPMHWPRSYSCHVPEPSNLQGVFLLVAQHVHSGHWGSYHGCHVGELLQSRSRSELACARSLCRYVQMRSECRVTPEGWRLERRMQPSGQSPMIYIPPDGSRQLRSRKQVR